MATYPTYDLNFNNYFIEIVYDTSLGTVILNYDDTLIALYATNNFLISFLNGSREYEIDYRNCNNISTASRDEMYNIIKERFDMYSISLGITANLNTNSVLLAITEFNDDVVNIGTTTHSKLDTLDTSINNLEFGTTVLNNIVIDNGTTTHAKLDTLDTSINTLNTNVINIGTTTHSKLDTLDTSINTVDTSINTLNTNVINIGTTTHDKLDTLNTTNTNIGTTTHTKLDTIDTSITDFDTAVKNIGTTTHSKLDTIDTSINTVDTSVNTVNTSINTLNTNTINIGTTTHTKLDIIETSLASIELDLEAINLDMVNIGTTTHTKLDTIDLSINALDTTFINIGTTTHSKLDSIITNTSTGVSSNTYLQSLDTNIDNCITSSVDTGASYLRVAHIIEPDTKLPQTELGLMRSRINNYPELTAVKSWYVQNSITTPTERTVGMPIGSNDDFVQWITTETQLQFTSTSNNDVGVTGTGARVIFVDGLARDTGTSPFTWFPVSETLTMNGQLGVSSTRTDWWRINKIWVTGVGSQQVNDGDIYVSPAGWSTTAGVPAVGGTICAVIEGYANDTFGTLSTGNNQGFRYTKGNMFSDPLKSVRFHEVFYQDFSGGEDLVKYEVGKIYA
jgi:hypothetical protein